jgi:hypothetical protein
MALDGSGKPQAIADGLTLLITWRWLGTVRKKARALDGHANGVRNDSRWQGVDECRRMAQPGHAAVVGRRLLSGVDEHAVQAGRLPSLTNSDINCRIIRTGPTYDLNAG